MKRLKVWGGTDAGRGRLLVAAHTKAEAAIMLKQVRNTSRHYFDEYFAETFNEEELRICDKPGVWRSDEAIPPCRKNILLVALR
jgi:hypothetical protein